MRLYPDCSTSMCVAALDATTHIVIEIGRIK